MGVRGPKSAAALAVVQPLPGKQRPEPPPELSKEAAVEWKAVVAALPPEWFTRPSHAVLAAYCEHVVAARRLHDMVASFETVWAADEEGLARLDHLLRLRDRETKALADKATKLRMTNQSHYTPQAAGTAARQGNARAPWQGYGSDRLLPEFNFIG
jgi:hypothetical protein